MVLSVFINLSFIALLPLSDRSGGIPWAFILGHHFHFTLHSGEFTDVRNVSDHLSATDVRVCINTALSPELWVIRPVLVHLTSHLTFISVHFQPSQAQYPHSKQTPSPMLPISVNDTEVYPVSQAHLLVSRKPCQSNLQNISQIIFPSFCLHQNHHNQVCYKLHLLWPELLTGISASTLYLLQNILHFPVQVVSKSASVVSYTLRIQKSYYGLKKNL